MMMIEVGGIKHKVMVGGNLTNYILCHMQKIRLFFNFNYILSNKSSNENLDILDKQQYYIGYYYKVYE